MPCTLRGLRSGVQGGRARKNLAVKEKEYDRGVERGKGRRKRNLLRVYNVRGVKTAARAKMGAGVHEPLKTKPKTLKAARA